MIVASYSPALVAFALLDVLRSIYLELSNTSPERVSVNLKSEAFNAISLPVYVWPEPTYSTFNLSVALDLAIDAVVVLVTSP